MHYQVVVRPCEPSGTWSYYPYWAPGRDPNAAERLALYAAQSGYEAAIVHSVTVEMLQEIARRVVERQDTQMLPTVRFLPPAESTGASQHHVLDMASILQTFDVPDARRQGQSTAELDKRRLELELGSGGDVAKARSRRPGRVVLPLRMDVLSAWLGLRARMLQGQVGGPTDGSATSPADAGAAADLDQVLSDDEAHS